MRAILDCNGVIVRAVKGRRFWVSEGVDAGGAAMQRLCLDARSGQLDGKECLFESKRDKLVEQRPARRNDDGRVSVPSRNR